MGRPKLLTKKQAKECKICSRPAYYRYYHVHSCESCKQFFRRVVINLREYWCRLDGHCQIGPKGRNCFSCKLDKCLRVGMQPTMVESKHLGISHEFVARLIQRKNAVVHRQTEEEARHIPPRKNAAVQWQIKQEQSPVESKQESPNCCIENLPTPLENCWKNLDFLLEIEQKQKCFWDSLTDLPMGYLDGFNSVEQLLKASTNLLDKAHLFEKIQPKHWNKAAYIAECEQYLPTQQDIGFFSVDTVLAIEMAKTRAFPAFYKLSMEHKVALLNHIAIPVLCLFNAFYSASAGHSTWTRSNGLQFIAGYQIELYKGEKNLERLSRRLFCETVEAVKLVNLDREEFVLLLAILFSSSTADMSLSAKDLLYAECVCNCRQLLDRLQQRMGQAPGAKQYADCLQFINFIILRKSVLGQMFIYLEVIYNRHERLTMPEPLAFIGI